MKYVLSLDLLASENGFMPVLFSITFQYDLICSLLTSIYMHSLWTYPLLLSRQFYVLKSSQIYLFRYWFIIFIKRFLNVADAQLIWLARKMNEFHEVGEFSHRRMIDLVQFIPMDAIFDGLLKIFEVDFLSTKVTYS